MERFMQRLLPMQGSPPEASHQKGQKVRMSPKKKVPARHQGNEMRRSHGNHACLIYCHSACQGEHAQSPKNAEFIVQQVSLLCQKIR